MIVISFLIIILFWPLVVCFLFICFVQDMKYEKIRKEKERREILNFKKQWFEIMIKNLKEENKKLNEI